MSDKIIYKGIGGIFATFKTATVSDVAKCTTSDIGKLVTLNADGQVGIDATNTTELGIVGVLSAVSSDGNSVTVQIGGLAEVTCGETVAYGANRTYLGTYNGKLYIASGAVVTKGCPISLVEGGTTTKKAIIKL